MDDVKELLRMGSFNMIKILPWLRLARSRMALLSLARNIVPWKKRDRDRNLPVVPSYLTRKLITEMTPLWVLPGNNTLHISDFLYK